MPTARTQQEKRELFDKIKWMHDIDGLRYRDVAKELKIGQNTIFQLKKEFGTQKKPTIFEQVGDEFERQGCLDNSEEVTVALFTDRKKPFNAMHLTFEIPKIDDPDLRELIIEFRVFERLQWVELPALDKD